MRSDPFDARDGAERIAIDVLSWLARDEERVLTFLQATGLSPGAIRTAAHDPGFLGGVLDHVMGEEAALLDCAKDLELAPERIAAAWERLRPPDFDHTA